MDVRTCAVTAAILLRSDRWRSRVHGAEVATLIRVGPLPLRSFTETQHTEIRAWALGIEPELPVPKPITDYIAAIQPTREN